jgi:putative membrane-bound dehydrogenase-like protein
MKFRFIACAACIIALLSCNNDNTKQTTAQQTSDTLTEAQLRLPQNALKGLTVANGMHIATFATEPMLQNPTNIDVDDRGRVWVCEAYNYRPAINGNPTNALGDRIMILEDTNGDGQADTAKVFYQGPELNAPLGICVLGNRVIVSQSPYVWSFYDDNGDDKADRKEIMFEGISGEQHDHGIHAFTFGPDGKLYFNAGNEGKQLKDKNGKAVLDQDGHLIDQKNYRQGMVFRCNPDGSKVEVLGQNFRNPYEVCVDSYGTMWQSDNDDDGNRGTRINYVMPYGNYGYKDEMTGASWQANRTNIEDSIPMRHWHLNDPGVVPNLLQTFAGSPTGIVLYEGSLFPSLKNQMIHCDAGTNVVRAYPAKKSGAGYTASISNLVNGDKDRWFRPADICVAPDGSLIIADWYDPGVGGHQAGDQTKGRIYRLTPDGGGYTLPKIDYTTPEGAVEALQNPNLTVRYKAFTALQKMGNTAVPALEKQWLTGTDSRMRARAFWMLVNIPGADKKKYINDAIGDKDADLRIAGLRAACEFNADVPDALTKLITDPDVQVRRECAIALHHRKFNGAAALWTSLARQYDGQDRWYLEALGIGADGQWDEFYNAYQTAELKAEHPAALMANVAWRARTNAALPMIAQMAADSTQPLQDRLKYFRAFDFEKGTMKNKYLLHMLGRDTAMNKLVLRHLDAASVQSSPIAQRALNEVLKGLRGTPEYLELVGRYHLKTENPQLLEMAIAQSDRPTGRNAASLLLEQDGQSVVEKIINGDDQTKAESLLASLGGVGSKASLALMQQVALGKKYAMPLRRTAAERIGNSGSGEDLVLQLLRAKKVPTDMIPSFVISVSNSWRTAVKKEAQSYLPNNDAASAGKRMPTMQDMVSLKADAINGKKIFSNRCATCHQVNGTGYDFGPKLSEIGSKLPKEGLLEAILHPSSGIAFGYEGWELTMKDGSKMTGLIASKTETDIDLKLPGGIRQALKTADVKQLTEMKASMMPEGIYETMSTQEMADLLEFLEGLKKK